MSATAQLVNDSTAPRSTLTLNDMLNKKTIYSR